jgi:outer membrane lipase/esterase
VLIARGWRDGQECKMEYRGIEISKGGRARWRTLSIIGAVVSSAAGSCAGATFSQIIVFGDSSVDSGYYRALASPGANATYNAYWATAVASGAGSPTSSPGLMYPQVLASYFGLTANPSNQRGGTNYATSGAKNVDVNSSINGGFKAAIPTVTQIANYLAANGNRADANALYLVSSGGNDLGYASGFTGTGPYPSDPTGYLTSRAISLATAIASLKSAGAQLFVVALQQQATGTYSQALLASLSNQGVPVIVADITTIMGAIYRNPASYGLTSVSNAAGHTACTPPPGITTAWALLCSSNPNAPSTFSTPNADMTNLFADDQHLATAGQKIIADYVYKLLLQNVPMVASDCLFNWAEQHYASMFSPAATSQTYGPYYYRYYAPANVFLGASSTDKHVYYSAGGVSSDVGPASTWYSTAGCQ